MYICPKCKQPLIRVDKTFKCAANHSYDVASQGYVNLLLGNKSTSKHGDNKMMINARRAFLSLGHYEPIITELTRLISEYAKSDDLKILDAGCGEGYYTDGILCSLAEKHGILSEIYGTDVSKEAVVKAASAYKKPYFSVSSVNALPFGDGTFDFVVSLFAPLAENEFARVLSENGVLITVSPSPRHLFGMKEIVYDTPYENPVSTFSPALFASSEEHIFTSEMTLDSSEAILDLFTMTPYCYNTGKDGLERIRSVKKLTTEIGFVFGVYKKI